ncbi:MAG: peptidoglycan D,D-transpeptidase FtsI family protein [Lachnospiraceae bacterium]
MYHSERYVRKKIALIMGVVLLGFVILCGRLVYLMVFCSAYYQKQALDLHQRERSIKAARGKIYDRNGVELATNKPVCTISVIHSQIKEAERVIEVLSGELEMDEKEVRKKVEKISSREKIKSNVDREVGEKIRDFQLAGVMIDEDYKRYYPYDDLCSKVLGFTGSDNQGIVGLEVTYDKYLQGKNGSILTLTDARGVEIPNAGEDRAEPVPGKALHTSLDFNIQKYAEQACKKVKKKKNAKSVSMVIMNPQNGEIYAMVNIPEYHLNDPFTLNINQTVAENKLWDELNKMWRNDCIHDTYEPGSTFKIVTATAALEEKVVSVNDYFSCPGFRIVEDRRIRCHKAGGHGQETFREGIMNSCNPVFMDVGARVGAKNMYKYYRRLGLFEKTGIDLPGEANSIMHKLSNVKAVELATMSFGQSFQITPMQLLRAASAVINGGNLITPHFGVKIGERKLQYPVKSGAVSKETSDLMCSLLEDVVREGSGNKGSVEGYRIGGKTATSEKLPRGTGKYISSFLGFAPADHPLVIGLIMIEDPEGIYYGGTIAAPVMSEMFENILPYLGIPKSYSSQKDK